MYAACLSKGGFEEEKFDNHSATLAYIKSTAVMKKDANNDKKETTVHTGQGNIKQGEEGMIALETPELFGLEDADEDKNEDHDATRKLTIKDFKLKAEQYASQHFDEFAKKKPKHK